MIVALFLGSFNPLHWGHVAIGHYIIDKCKVNQIQYILSPINPLKEGQYLEDPQSRLKRLQEEIAQKFNDSRVVVSDIEFHLAKPLYTINTLRHLRDNNPENQYILIIGADNLAIIDKWYKWHDILLEFEVWVYPRAPHDAKILAAKYNAMNPQYRIRAIDAPLHNISSTQIREKNNL